MVRLKSPLLSATAVGRLAQSPPVSSSYRNRLRRDAVPDAPPTPPPPTCDYIVTGSTTPDVTGCYNYGGIHEGYPYWERDDFAYTMWTFKAGFLVGAVISPAPGYEPLDCFHRRSCLSATPDGIYDPGPNATGIATAAASP